MALLEILLNIMDPFKILRVYMLKPVSDMCFIVFNNYKNKTKDKVSSAKELLLRTTIGLFAAAIIVWTSIFLYIAFYYAYMPAVAHMRPVYMQFKSCDEVVGPCSFPSAHVSLTKKQQLLMVGQPYKVILNIDMPESPQNQNLGMFMVCAEMRDQTSNLRGHSCRSAMLPYKSNIVTALSTMWSSPLLILGFKEEKQLVPIELFSNYEDDQTHPVTDVYVEIQSKQIQFYSVSLHISAHFTGLRYIMFHWPILSAFLGISTNLFFILLISLLSWYHWSDTTWIDDAKEKYKRIRRSKSNSLKDKSQLEADYSTSIDESNNILDDEELSVMEDIKSISNIDDFEDVTTDDPEGLRKRNLNVEN